MQQKSLLTGLALLVLFFTIANSLPWGESSSSEIYYSDFIAGVNSGEVVSVTMRGNQIEGKMINGREFNTIGTFDPRLIELLKEKKVQISVKQEDEHSWFYSILLQWGPLLLLIGVWIAMMKKMPGSGKIMSIGKSKAKKADENTPTVTFKQVAGVDEAKVELGEVVEYLMDPGKFQKLGGKIPKGVLMVGPPGTGKTLLARAVAGEAGVPFFSISGSDFVEMFVGVGASRVRDLFNEGRQDAPCIIFIDEIDAVGRHRGAGLGSGHDEREQTLNQLLVEMDGFDTSDGVIIIAATNRADILDPALLRPGRFDRQVHVPLPDINGREQILKVHCKKVPLKEGVNLRTIARGTPGFSGAELANLVNESALWAARANKKEIELSDLEWARDKVMMGAERRSMIMTDKEKQLTAYHEAGHALVASFVEKSDPLHKVTIIPRGQALGLTSFLPEADRLSMDKESLTCKIAIAMGGRVAEKLVFNESSTGAEGDIKHASELAQNMICRWGMGKRLGALTIDQSNSGNYLALDYNKGESISEEVQEIVDQEVQEMLKTGEETAFRILRDNIQSLHTVSEILLKEETISADRFYEVIGKDTPLPENENHFKIVEEEVAKQDSDTKDQEFPPEAPPKAEKKEARESKEIPAAIEESKAKDDLPPTS